MAQSSMNCLDFNALWSLSSFSFSFFFYTSINSVTPSDAYCSRFRLIAYKFTSPSRFVSSSLSYVLSSENCSALLSPFLTNEVVGIVIMSVPRHVRMMKLIVRFAIMLATSWLLPNQYVVRKLKQKTPNILAKSKTALTAGFLSGKYI